MCLLFFGYMIRWALASRWEDGLGIEDVGWGNYLPTVVVVRLGVIGNLSIHEWI